MKDKEFRERLIRRYVNNQANEEELEAYFHLLRQGELDELLEKYMEEEGKTFKERREDQEHQEYQEFQEQPEHRTARVRKLWIRVAAAAVILIFLSVGISLLLTDKPQYEKVALNNDVTPGGNKATLTLADGRTISLTEAASGELAVQSGVVVRKAADGQLVYEVAATNDATVPLTYNTIATPRGGQYQVVLPDGSEVWLNAASSLKYPASFSGLQERQVELTGEAYFEVAADKDKPFVVVSGQQSIEVLGTHFNVNAYRDEPATKTTLLGGSIRLHSEETEATYVLSPGQQAIKHGTSFQVVKVDAQSAIAWKNGKFVFNGESLESILLKVARWYDVAIEFQDEQAKEIRFGGTMSRFENISKVLNKLEITGNVQFKMVQDAALSSPKVIVELKISE